MDRSRAEREQHALAVLYAEEYRDALVRIRDAVSTADLERVGPFPDFVACHNSLCALNELAEAVSKIDSELGARVRDECGWERNYSGGEDRRGVQRTFKARLGVAIQETDALIEQLQALANGQEGEARTPTGPKAKSEVTPQTAAGGKAKAKRQRRRRPAMQKEIIDARESAAAQMIGQHIENHKEPPLLKDLAKALDVSPATAHRLQAWKRRFEATDVGRLADGRKGRDRHGDGGMHIEATDYREGDPSDMDR